MEEIVRSTKLEAWEEFRQEKCEKSNPEEIDATQRIFSYSWDRAVTEVIGIQMKITEALNKRNKKQ